MQVYDRDSQHFFRLLAGVWPERPPTGLVMEFKTIGVGDDALVASCAYADLVDGRLASDPSIILPNWLGCDFLDEKVVTAQIRDTRRALEQQGRSYPISAPLLRANGSPACAALAGILGLLQQAVIADKPVFLHNGLKFSLPILFRNLDDFCPGLDSETFQDDLGQLVVDTGLVEAARQVALFPEQTESLSDWSVRCLALPPARTNLEQHCAELYELRLSANEAAASELLREFYLQCGLLRWIHEATRWHRGGSNTAREAAAS